MSTHQITAAAAGGQNTVGYIQQFLDGTVTINGQTFQPGDTVELSGTFYNDGDTGRLKLLKDVTLRGANGVNATISGGTQLEWGRKDEPAVKVTATIDHITFDNFIFGAIKIAGADGDNVISNCEFVNYRYGISGVKDGAFPIVCGSSKVSGTLTISGCRFGVPSKVGMPAGGMNNVVHVNNCDLQQLNITGNTFDDTCFMGFAVWGVSGFTTITGNRITKKSSWNGHPGVGIEFGIRPDGYVLDRDGGVRIENNDLVLDTADSCGIMVGVYPEEQYVQKVPPVSATREITVRNNRVHLTNASNKMAALACIGGCANSRWTMNTVTGYGRYGIVVRQHMPPQDAPLISVEANGPPTNNTFDDNDLTQFTASQAQVFADGTATKLDVRHNDIGPVSGKNDAALPPPWDQPCAGVVWYGTDGWIVLNDFSVSGIDGFNLPPQGQPGGPKSPHVGAIYLAETSTGNSVVYRKADFPKGKMKSQEDQILDVSMSNTIEELLPVKKEPASPGVPEPQPA